MNRLPSSSSFQGVLDSIIRNYLLNELPPEGAENGNTRHHVAEKDLGFLQASGLHLSTSNPHASATTNVQNEVNNNPGPVPSTSTANISANPSDHEYIRAVYQCFEKRGVFKELQTFLRHKLVSILQDEWPNLQKPVSASQKEGPNTIIYRLVDDFLRCHKLLYTLSVLASESDVKQQSTRVLYGKLSSKDAEDLLDEMGIKHNSRLSGQILKCYFDKENFSLLESMQYLGIWLDDSSIQLDNLQQENGGTTAQGRRRGSAGESIALSHHNKRCKEKATETAAFTESKKGESGNAIGVEQRLLELERNLEREKEFKIKEAIEKYKKDEQIKLREELETKFKLQLVEKDREHFLDVQKRMTELNAEMQEERQQWLEEKLKQEKELCEFRRQMNEMMNASGDSNWKSATRPITNAPKPVNTATKTCQVEMDDSSPRCSCRKHLTPSHSRDKDNFPTRQPTPVESIEQDRLAFLQYKMEQQDEEIKSLRRQLLLSSRIPPSKSRPTLRLDDGEINEQHDANRQPTGNGTPRSDDLTTFLTESRARVAKLDTAVDKVDEIVQELFTKRRSLLSEEVSSRLISVAMKKNKQPLSQLYTSLQTMSMPNTALLSPLSFSPVVPLVHQQVPEKQRATTSSVIQNTPPAFNPRTAFTQHTSFPTPPLKHYPSPPPAASLRRRSESHKKSPAVEDDREEHDRPETPVERIFPVVYEQPAKATQKQLESQGNSKESSPESVSMFRRATTNNGDNNNRKSGSEVIVEPEESLFHMAIRNNDTERNKSSSDSEKAKKTLEEKAIRHGALSRERIFSSDEGDNSISLSLSIAESKSKKVTKSVLQPVFNNNNGSVRKVDTVVRPISKSKMSETVDDNSVELPASVASVKSVAMVDERRQSVSTGIPLIKSKIKSPTSSSSSSSRKSFSIARSQNGNGNQRQNDDDDNDEQSSISISVPKSLDGEDNNEDFWQL